MCEVDPGERSYTESVLGQKVVFVRTGMFSRLFRGQEAVADPGQILFFDERDYAFRHPPAGGNRCTIIEAPPDVMAEVRQHFEAGRRDVSTRQVAAPRGWVRRHYELISSLVGSGDAALSIEELSLELLHDA